MSTSSAGVISKPVTQTDIASATGKSLNSGLGNMITAGTINKWSIHKPTRINQLTEVTEAQMIAQQCGLSPVSLTYLKAMEYYYGAGGYTKAQCEGQISEWTYNRPQGTSYGSPFRQLDFNGYDPNSRPSDVDWAGVTIDKANLLNVYNGTVTVSSGVVTASVEQVQVNYSAHLIINGSHVYIGSSGSTYQLPMNYAAGSDLVSSAWRMGLAIWLPSVSRYVIFVGKYPFNNTSPSSPTADYSVDLATNQLGCKEIYDNVSAGTQLDCTPILVRDCSFGFNSASKCYTYFGTSSTATVYCVPSGTTTFQMTVTDSGAIPTIGNMVVVAKIGSTRWYVGYVDTGNYAQSWPLRNFIIATDEASTTGKTFTGTITYSYAYGSSNTLTVNQAIATGATVTVNGTTYYGALLSSGAALPGLSFVATGVNLSAV